ncbi:hypothetical protein CNR27_04435 [Luteimonas chenhongjianii]|uniref:DUF4124 domain-containing protein n=1 Tax=Luteimonas chenhongjianii TaxID=2006110 RepID=A0A290XCA8_9GAMM|nr:hypothetical protein [Luteimonas chenhongjianii]ATD66785.1 hypothetical protein CNR27_04435 [Luteimonas chenhongjianii]
MRSVTLLMTLLLAASFPALAQQLRNPADPPARASGSLRPVDAPSRLPAQIETPATRDPARERCLQQAARTITPTSDARIRSAQRRAAAIETQRAARGGDAADPADRSGLRASRDAQQRAAVRERNAANQRMAIAEANCR